MRNLAWPVILALAVTIILLATATRWTAEEGSPGSTLSMALALLFPVGLAAVAWSALPSDRANRAAGLATLALALAMIGYLALGFGFQFGGAAFVSETEELQNLSRFFSLVHGDNSAGWGFIGLEGFFLNDDAASSAAVQLFISQLPLIMATVLIAMLGMPRRAPLGAVVLTGLFISAITFPVAGHWVSGGGWLARLGDTLALGHGVVDFAGSGLVFVVGGATVLAAAAVFGHDELSADKKARDDKRLRSAAMPETQFPILAGMGALLAAVGWIGIGLANPLYAEASDVLNWPQITLNGLAGLAGGAFTAQLYSWFTSGRFDPLMGPRGALAGLVTVGAGAPFYPTWAALIIGAIAGLLLPLVVFIIYRTFRLDDVTAAVAGYLLPGIWGLLAVGILANGRWGQGWNRAEGLPGQGVSGLLVAPGFQADHGQIAAQIWGIIAILALAFTLPWGIFKLAAWLSGLRRSKTDSRRRESEATSPGNPNVTGSDLQAITDIDKG